MYIYYNFSKDCTAFYIYIRDDDAKDGNKITAKNSSAVLLYFGGYIAYRAFDSHNNNGPPPY